MSGTLEPTVSRLREVACEAARAGGAELLARLNVPREIHFKGGIDLVTDADRAAEEKIVGVLQAHFPEHALLAEERGVAKGSAPYRWIVDPLDGTTNYAHGVPIWCVSIAVEGPKGLLAGAIFDPSRGELFSAGVGEGATRNGAAISVSRTAELGHALLATGFPYDLWEKPEPTLRLFGDFAVRSRGMRRLGSAAIDLAYVACGRLDGFFEHKLKAWDVAAGALLVCEAGGRVTNLSGAPLNLDEPELLASNGPLHAAMIEVAAYSSSRNSEL